MDENFKELGIISDFTIDLAYGKDENDFEIKTPENEMQQGYYWYIKDTEYGGVVDEIVAYTSTKEVTYKGRSWQGILNSYSGMGLPRTNSEVLITSLGVEDNDYIALKGRLDLILNEILNTDLKLNVTVGGIDDEVDIRLSANQKIYDLLTDLCNQLNLKVKTYFDDGEWVVELVHNVNYTQGQYFDTSQYNITAISNKAVPNHLIGVYKKDGKSIIKHIYTDEFGNVQPYYVLDPIHDTPAYNWEYKRALDNKIVEGKDEIVEVIEAGSTVERYDKVSAVVGIDDDHPYGTEGNTPFLRDNDGNPTEPVDWKEKYFTDYYHIKMKTEGGREVPDLTESGELQYELYIQDKEHGDFEPFIPQQTMSNYIWSKSWGSYYKRVEDTENPGWVYKFEPLTDSDVVPTTYKEIMNKDHITGAVRPEPVNWSNDYKNYYIKVTDTQGHETFESVSGISKEYMQLQSASYSTNINNYFQNHIDDYFYKWHYPKWKVEVWWKSGGKWKKAQVPKSVKSDIENDLKSSNVVYVKDSLKNYKVFGTMTLLTAIQEYGVYTSSGKKVGGLNTYKEVLFTKKIKVQRGNVKYIVHPQTTYKTNYISMDDYCKKTKQKKKNLKYKANKYYKKVNYEIAPNWAKSSGDGGWYYKEFSSNTIPDPSQTYYKFTDAIYPPYKRGEAYKKVTDDYTTLCEEMIKKLNEYKEKSQTIEPKLDTDIQEFDVGDVVGGVHPFTKEEMTTRITKKIVKGGTFGVTVEYEIG